MIMYNYDEKSQVLNSEKTVLELILIKNGLTLTEFAILLFGEKQNNKSPINRLNQYRTGKREFRLTMRQIKTINQLLEPLGMSIDELPDNWILDKN